MNDQRKTKKQLLEELERKRERLIIRQDEQGSLISEWKDYVQDPVKFTREESVRP